MAINNWWDDDPRESFWVEIKKDPEGLGEYLRAPKSAAGGRSHWTYDLTSYVEPGDRIFHWYKIKQASPASSAGQPLSDHWTQFNGRGRREAAMDVKEECPAMVPRGICH